MSTDEQALLAKALNVPVGDFAEAFEDLKQGNMAALEAIAPKLLADVQNELTAIQAAAPLIKKGMATSEWQAIVGYGATQLLCSISTALGHPVNFDVTGVLGALVGLYALGRTLLKHKELAVNAASAGTKIVTTDTSKQTSGSGVVTKQESVAVTQGPAAVARPGSLVGSGAAVPPAVTSSETI